MSTLEELPETATVMTILPEMRERPDASLEMVCPKDRVAHLIRQWADGINRPVNGSFAQLGYKD